MCLGMGMMAHRFCVKESSECLRLISAIFLSLFLAIPSAFADTAILVALPSELDGVRKEVRIVGQSVELAGHKVSIGYHKGEKVYIVRTGAGIINAAMTTQAVLTRYKVDRVISIGVAGCIGEKAATTEILRQAQDDNLPAESRKLNTESMHIGDIFIATDIINHQQGKETPAGFEAKKETEGRSQKSEGYDKKCEELRSNAVEVATTVIGQAARLPSEENDGKRDARPTNIRTGRLASGESFIASTEKRKWLHETLKADAVDMVSAGIARVCEANGVPYVIIRVLSDNADESASADFAAFVQSLKEPVTVPIAIGLLDHLAVKPP